MCSSSSSGSSPPHAPISSSLLWLAKSGERRKNKTNAILTFEQEKEKSEKFSISEILWFFIFKKIREKWIMVDRRWNGISELYYETPSEVIMGIFDKLFGSQRQKKPTFEHVKECGLLSKYV